MKLKIALIALGLVSAMGTAQKKGLDAGGMCVVR